MHTDELIVFTARKGDATVEEVLGESRMQRVWYARRLGYWLAHRIYGYGPCRIGRMFNRDHNSVIKGLKSVERRRDRDLPFRHWLNEIEDSARAYLTR